MKSNKNLILSRTTLRYFNALLLIIFFSVFTVACGNKKDNVDSIEVNQNDENYRKELSNSHYSNELLQKAESGDIKAQLALAYAYKNGNGITQNYNEAFKWFKKSAEGGNVWAQHDLGVMYKNGLGCEQNYTEAVKWYMKAAEQNDALAQFNLSLCYEHGWGVEENLSESVKWLKKAADNGEAVAQFNLGLSYYDGYGVEKNYNMAIKYFREAANQGMEEAISILNQLGVQ